MDRWAKEGRTCEPPDTCHVSMMVDKSWSTHTEACVEGTYTTVIGGSGGGKKEPLLSMLRRLTLHISRAFPMGDLSPEPQSVSHLNDAAASSSNSALERICRVDAAIYDQLTKVFPEGWEAEMVLGVQQDGEGKDESSSHARSGEGGPLEDDSKGKEESAGLPEAREGTV